MVKTNGLEQLQRKSWRGKDNHIVWTYFGPILSKSCRYWRVDAYDNFPVHFVDCKMDHFGVSYQLMKSTWEVPALCQFFHQFDSVWKSTLYCLVWVPGSVWIKATFSPTNPPMSIIHSGFIWIHPYVCNIYL